MAFYRLEKLINLYDGYRKVFRIEGVSLLLIQEEGQRYLIKNQCPHKAFPLDKGSLRRGVLRCPHHAMEFDLNRGGRCLQHPSDCVAMYALQYDGNDLGVELSL